MPRTPPLEEEQQKPKEKERPDLTDPRQRLLAYVLVELVFENVKCITLSYHKKIIDTL